MTMLGSIKAQTIIIDNVTGGSSAYKETGTWNNSSASGYYGTKSRVPGNSNDPSRMATFTPNIVTPGVYKVYENHAAATNRVVNDVNVMYDAHMYTPWEYCIQYSAAYGKAGTLWGTYNPVNPVWVRYIGGTLSIVPQGTSGAVPFNKNYLQNCLVEDILQFGSTANVPVNVGEWGLCH